MAIVTTVGGPSANSYATVAEADLYCAEHGITAWDDLDDDDEKAPALLKATQWMDGNFRGSIKGRKANADQALAFPRKGCSDEDGNAFDEDVIPTCWKNATIEVAAREGDNPGTLFPDLDRLTQSEKIGSISVTYVKGDSAKVELTVVDNLISGLLVSGGNTITGFLSRA